MLNTPRRITVFTVSLACLVGAAFALPDPVRADDPLLNNTRQLTFEGKRAGEGYFSADGTKLIFQSEREKGNPFYQMYVMDLETGDIERVSPGHGKTTCGWLHPDGKRAMFSSTQDDPGARAKQKAELDKRASGKQSRYSWSFDEYYDIQEIDLASGKYKKLTDVLGYDAEGSYSPDGKLIAFASNRAAYSEKLSEKEQKIFKNDKSYFMDIYIMNADGSNVRRLTKTPGYDGGPFFSADGKKITWRRFNEKGSQAEVYTMNIDGTDQRQITRLGAMSWAPYFHPSGDYLIFATNLQGFANFELYIVDAEGKKEPVRVTNTTGFDGLPAFSPDGKRLAWSSTRTSNKSSQLFIADWNDAEARRLLGLNASGKKSETKANGTSITPQISKTVAAIRVEDLKLHLAALASEKTQGRLTGTEGEKLAASYVARSFAALGLEPAGDDGGFIQNFSFTAGVSLGPDNALTLETASGKQQLKLDADWRPLAFSGAGKTEAAPVVFAGFGIVAPGDQGQKVYDSYAKLDVKDKWVLVYRGLPNEADSKRRLHLTRYSELRYKASTARSKGAKGLIIAPAPGVEYKDELVRLTYEASKADSSMPVLSVNGKTSKLMLAVLGQKGDALIKALQKGQAAGGARLPGVSVSTAIDLTFERRTGRNVIARLKTGASGNVPPVIIGAHLDHLGRGETSGSRAKPSEAGQIHYGADDNASGVSALIEIAQWLADSKKNGKLKAKRDIIFAAWSGEELGLLGSSHYVKDLMKAKGQKDLKGLVSAYLNMDMVGRLRQSLSLFGIGSSSAWTREVERRNAPIGLSITTSNDSYLPTDATSFYLKGVPVLHAFTGTHDEYSTPRDKPETINYEGLQKIARFMGLIARSQAMADTPPDYIKRDRPKGSGARRMSNVYLGTIPDYAGEGKKGVPISGAMKGGPAEKAGMKDGDVIVRLAGTEIENIYDFVRAMNGLKVGETVEVIVLRGDERKILSITPAPRE